jgi:hypothetical protein
MAKLASVALQSKEYRLSDLQKWMDGANRGSGPMWDSYITWDAATEVSKVEIPVYFFSGINDYNTPLELVREYYEQLNAPEGKDIVVFENSSHTPHMMEPEKFCEEMIRVKEETYANKDVTEDKQKNLENIKTDSGRYQGRADSNFIEIMISGVPGDAAYRVFMLSDKLKEDFDIIGLEKDQVIKFNYYQNEQGQFVIVDITIIKN